MLHTGSSRFGMFVVTILVFLAVMWAPAIGRAGEGFEKKFVPGGFVHVRYTNGENDGNEFLVSHARVSVKGNLNPWLGFRLHVDLAKSRVFKDAFADIRLAPWLKARCGQFKYRFGVFQPPRDYATIHKPSVRTGLLGEPRDVGVALIGNPKPLRFNVAVINGTANRDASSAHQPARGPGGKPVTVEIDTRTGKLLAKVWLMHVGRVRLYLLDCDVPSNSPEDRELTSRLYGGDNRTRIRQELVVGVGGVRALHDLGIIPGAFHLNEGHCGFATLEADLAQARSDYERTRGEQSELEARA